MFTYKDQALEDIPHIRHGFFGRRDGVSTGIYQSLNTAYSAQDQKEHVTENRRRISQHLGLRSLVNCAQIHSADVIDVTAPWTQDKLPEGDAMFSLKTGIGLGVQTADCAPILIADRTKPIIGAAHAGWGGAFKGVTDNLIAKMLDAGATENNLIVAIGPCIHQHSYEVGPEFYQRFVETDIKNQKYFVETENQGHVLFDLPLYIEDRIKQRFPKIAHIFISPHDTYAEDTHFFSYRRATHREDPDYGRQMSVIALAE
ncbi:MAG: peptidoglycan editing factor PgeF [Pseudomonadota bacterium]